MRDINVKLGSDFDPTQELPLVLGTSSHPGALFKLGDRIRKINTEPGDMVTNGTLGIVLSVLHDDEYGDFYFVQFDVDGSPPVGIQASRIAQA